MKPNDLNEAVFLTFRFWLHLNLITPAVKPEAKPVFCLFSVVGGDLFVSVVFGGAAGRGRGVGGGGG